MQWKILTFSIVFISVWAHAEVPRTPVHPRKVGRCLNVIAMVEGESFFGAGIKEGREKELAQEYLDRIPRIPRNLNFDYRYYLALAETLYWAERLAEALDAFESAFYLAPKISPFDMRNALGVAVELQDFPRARQFVAHFGNKLEVRSHEHVKDEALRAYQIANLKAEILIQQGQFIIAARSFSGVMNLHAVPSTVYQKARSLYLQGLAWSELTRTDLARGPLEELNLFIDPKWDFAQHAKALYLRLLRTSGKPGEYQHEVRLMKNSGTWQEALQIAGEI